MTRLIVAFPAYLIACGDEYSLDVKTLEGVSALARLWPDRLVLCAPLTDGPPGPGERWFLPDEAGFDVVTGPDLLTAVRRAGDGLILATLTASVHQLHSLMDRTVLMCEFSPEDLTAHDLSAASSLRARARVRVGGLRRTRALTKLVQTARGIQANGYPAFDRWRPEAKSAHLFFDSRITADDVEQARAKPRTTPQVPPHVAFSGRLIPAKGPEYAVDVARRLDVQLTVFGTGSLASTLQSQAPEHVTFAGHSDFETQWLPTVRTDIDLMILPHVQGDPSGTYLESAGCGVPVVGFDNVALKALTSRHGIGWTVPMRDGEALAAKVESVLSDPGEWARARTACLDFMARHDFASETERRVAHLLTLCQEG